MMKVIKKLENPFEELLRKLEDQYYNIIQLKFNQRLDKARDKQTVLDELVASHLAEYYFCFYKNNYSRNLLNDFYFHYQRGHIIDYCIAEIKSDSLVYKEADEEIENLFLKNANDQQLIKFFSKFVAYNKFLDYLNKHHQSTYQAFQKNLKEYNHEIPHLLSPDPFNRNQNLNYENTDRQKKSLDRLTTNEINIPNIKRVKGDNITSLSKDETIVFINLLREHNLIFKDESIQTKKDIAIAFSAITGYSDESIRKGLSNTTHEKDDLKKVHKKLSEICILINKALDKK